MGMLSSLYVEPLIWLVLFIGFLAAEFATAGLFTIWFAAGAFAALILAAIGVPIGIQIIAFIAVSMALLMIIRSWAQKKLRVQATKTNVDAMVGKQALVTETVSNLNHTGRAIVGGLDWSIGTENDNEIIEPGELVEVIRVSGVKLIVKKV